jgi:DNA invertase Pin-like site-specific DNA recombinase
MKRIAIYARVSTDKQTCENQLLELRATAERMRYQIIGEFVDSGISGAKGRADRPALDELLKAATQRRFDMVRFPRFFAFQPIGIMPPIPSHADA